MAENVFVKPAARSSDHTAAAPRANEPPADTQASRPRPAGGLRPSQVPVPGPTTRRTGSPSPAEGPAHQQGQRLRPSGAPTGAALHLARPSTVPARPIQDVLRDPGQPLAAPLKEEMQGRLGADLSDVRVHTDSAARASAAEVGARAYTSGSHVVIGDGGADKHTLAHELTHVIQQRQGPVAGTDHGNGFKVSDPFDAYEKAAEANAARVMRAPLSPHRLAAADTGEQCTPAVHPGGESEQTHQPAPNHAEATSDTGRHCQSGLVDVVRQSGARHGDLRTDTREAELEATARSAAPLAAPAVLQHRQLAGPPGPARLQRALRLYPTPGPAPAVEFLDLINSFLSPKYRVSQDAQGVVRLDPGAQPGAEITPEAARFYTQFKQIVDSGHWVSLTVLRGGRGAAGPVASFEHMAIDIGDIAAYGHPRMLGASAASLLIHELWEQFVAQASGAPYETAHARGIEAENYVSGFTRVADAIIEQTANGRVDGFLYAQDERAVLAEVHIEHNRVIMVRRHDVTDIAVRYLNDAGIAMDETLDERLLTIPAQLQAQLIGVLHLRALAAEAPEPEPMAQ